MRPVPILIRLGFRSAFVDGSRRIETFGHESASYGSIWR
jgi:hypothetical protein